MYIFTSIYKRKIRIEGKIKKVTHEEIQKVSEVAEPKLTLIIKELISKI